MPHAVLEKELAEFNAKKKGNSFELHLAYFQCMIAEAEALARKRQWQTLYEPRPTTSALPDVRLRKTSAPNAPLDYSMSQEGTYY